MFFLDIFEENWYSIINYYNSQKEVETMTIYDSELKVLEVLWENGHRMLPQHEPGYFLCLPV